MLSSILLSIFPAKRTFECLKKPVKGETRHWCIFWILFGSLRTLDPILSFIPFANFLSTFLLLANYNQHLSELTFRGGQGLARFCIQKIKNHAIITTVMDRVKEYYKSNSKLLDQVKTLVNMIGSVFTSLNANISSFAVSNFLLSTSNSISTSSSVSNMDNPWINSENGTFRNHSGRRRKGKPNHLSDLAGEQINVYADATSVINEDQILSIDDM